MYSEKLNELKIDREKKEINALLDGFCVREDLVKVPISDVFDLFDEYCKEKRKGPFKRISVGSAICKKFNLYSKTANVNGKSVRVYFEKE